MAGGFKIDKQAIRKMTRELEKEFAKNPVRVPLEGDASGMAVPGTTVNYNGPVVNVNGDHAQIAWGNQTVNQSQTSDIAPGFEGLAAALTSILASLPALALTAAEQADVEAEAHAVLGEVVKESPDPGAIRRSVTMIKGLLAPVASGIGEAVTGESAELAKTAIEALGSSLPL